MGGVGVSIRHFGDALVLDRRDSGNVVPRAGDDAVLLHFENTLGARLFEAAIWRTGTSGVRGVVWIDDGVDERREHVRNGESAAAGSWLGHQREYLAVGGNGGDLRGARRLALRDFQRSVAVLFDLGRRVADSHSRTV